uniref:Uncharacterized protein n=1 Tax=Myoviridae sp. ctCo31 TaxID=2825053 RepID=A0A8S5UMA6_9CAUD|nr:MAG TPA: hypothetical protein [Myoviridae sp. ctCo31]
MKLLGVLLGISFIKMVFYRFRRFKLKNSFTPMRK